MVAVACGIDWAEGHHDLAIVDEAGVVIVAERIDNDAAGLSRLLSVLDEHDPGGEPLPVAIETSTGLLVAGLRAAGRTVFAINPLAVSRYRDRYRTSGGKSDAFDAMVLANVLRTDRSAATTGGAPGSPGAAGADSCAARRGVGTDRADQSDPLPAQDVLPGSSERVRARRQAPAALAGLPHHPRHGAHP